MNNRSSAQMTEEWVSLWYQCLSMNIDYSLYCTARSEGDKKESRKLERKFEKIAGIYEDFGDLELWTDTRLTDASWRAWFEPRRHLFMSEPRVLTSPVNYTPQPGHILVEVPLRRTAKDTAAALTSLLKREYAAPDLQAAAPPKYVLRTIRGRSAHGIQQVRQACRSAALSYRYDPDTMEELRHVDAVAAFVRHEIDNMGWTLDAKARDELDRTGQLSEQRVQSFKSMLNKCRRDFKAFAANTIRASFPDDRPFESVVLDIF